MLKASTIVCVTDVSSASKQSLPLASKLARETGAKLVFVHVPPVNCWSMYAFMTINHQRERAEAAQRAEKFVREIMSGTPDVEWTLRVEHGEPADIINAAAKETGADLVVSARRRGRLEVLKSSSAAASIIDRLRPAETVPGLPRTAAVGV